MLKVGYKVWAPSGWWMDGWDRDDGFWSIFEIVEFCEIVYFLHVYNLLEFWNDSFYPWYIWIVYVVATCRNMCEVWFLCVVSGVCIHLICIKRMHMIRFAENENQVSLGMEGEIWKLSRDIVAATSPWCMMPNHIWPLHFQFQSVSFSSPMSTDNGHIFSANRYIDIFVFLHGL